MEPTFMPLRLLIIRVTLVLVFLELLIPPWRFSPDLNLPDKLRTAYRFLLTPPAGVATEIESSLLGFQIIITLALGLMIAYSVSARPIPKVSENSDRPHGSKKSHRRSYGRRQRRL